MELCGIACRGFDMPYAWFLISSTPVSGEASIFRILASITVYDDAIRFNVFMFLLHTSIVMRRWDVTVVEGCG